MLPVENILQRPYEAFFNENVPILPEKIAL